MDSDSIDPILDILNDTITISSGHVNSNWTTMNTIGAQGSYTWNNTAVPWITTTDSSTLQVKGDSDFDGDLRVQGRSLTEFMDSVEQRLNILRPNPALESEWDQLQALGNQYREMEKQLTEKAQMWAALQRTQSPVDK